uniref:Uncharacterized protein LOC107420723 n=1 Tax=Rhizophora mucronata TaxID=61149 RepID=A0A2P2LNJ2_RHIMU
MESSSLHLSVSQLSVFPPKPIGHNKAYPFCRPSIKKPLLPARLHCQKMYVPGFGEASPEAKAAKNLHNFFTYIAVKVVIAQLEVP